MNHLQIFLVLLATDLSPHMVSTDYPFNFSRELVSAYLYFACK